MKRRLARLLAVVGMSLALVGVVQSPALADRFVRFGFYFSYAECVAQGEKTVASNPNLYLEYRCVPDDFDPSVIYLDVLVAGA
jgi:hypothetical protein